MELKMRIEKREAKKAKNGFTYRVKINYVDEYGIKQTYTRSGFATKKEARAHGVEIEHELQTKGTLKRENPKTLNDCFLEALELEKGHLAPGTLFHYEQAYNKHVRNARIAQIPISKVNYMMLQTYFNSLSNQGKGIVSTQKAIFNRAFKHALKCGYIPNNPMHDIQITYKKEEKETHVLSYEELEKVIDCFMDLQTPFRKYTYCVITYCGYYLGLRIGEILALEKSDFDFKNDVVYVSKKLECSGLKKNELYLTERMKTKGSKAVLPVPGPLKEILLKWFEYNPYDLVCCDKDGNFIEHHSYFGICKIVGKKLGFNFHPHCLRHTYITNIVRSGCDIKTASKLARHSNIQTTLDVYTHTDESTKKEAISNAFGEIDTKKAPISEMLN